MNFEEDAAMSLEINLSVLDESSSNKDFPDINARDGITHLFGTYTENAITFLGFKCRSGKTSFVGTPNGNSFLYGVNKKQLQTIKTEVKDGLLAYILPGFETEEAAVKDAKRRLQEEIKQSAIFVWSIQCYSYTRNKEGDIDET